MATQEAYNGPEPSDYPAIWVDASAVSSAEMSELREYPGEVIRFKLPLNSKSPCAKCFGACCMDINIPLTKREAEMMTDAGTVLTEIPEEELVPDKHAGRGKWFLKRTFYKMTGTCAFYDEETKRCGIKNKRERPLACSDFAPETDLCAKARNLHRDLWLESELTRPNGSLVNLLLPQPEL